jgi:hypothetical protein
LDQGLEKEGVMEERFRYVEHKGKAIVLVDLSNLRDEKEIIALLRKRATIPSPHFLLAGLTNAHFTTAIVQEAKVNAKAVKPLIKAFAVVGAGGTMSIIASAVSKFSGMHIASFKTRGEAMDWLVKQ